MESNRSYAVHRIGLLALLLLWFPFDGTARGQGKAFQISDVQLIPLRDTVNRIKHFAPDGAPATVVIARGNFGSDIYMVLLDDTSLGTIPTGKTKGYKHIHLPVVVAQVAIERMSPK